MRPHSRYVRRAACRRVNVRILRRKKLIGACRKICLTEERIDQPELIRTTKSTFRDRLSDFRHCEARYKRRAFSDIFSQCHEIVNFCNRFHSVGSRVSCPFININHHFLTAQSCHRPRIGGAMSHGYRYLAGRCVGLTACIAASLLSFRVCTKMCGTRRCPAIGLLFRCYRGGRAYRLCKRFLLQNSSFTPHSHPFHTV